MQSKKISKFFVKYDEIMHMQLERVAISYEKNNFKYITHDSNQSKEKKKERSRNLAAACKVHFISSKK